LLTRIGAFNEKIRKWVQPPEFKADFDKAKKARSFGSCAWVQSQPAYVSWKAALRTTESGLMNHGKSKAQPCQPILWLEGRTLATSSNGAMTDFSIDRTSWLWKDNIIHSHNRRPQQ
jgi:hypothetical protein